MDWMLADPSHAADPRAARMILSEPEFAGDTPW